MSSAFPLLFKLDNQAIWQKRSLKLYPHVVANIPHFHLKPVYKYGELLQQQIQNNYTKVHLFFPIFI